MRRSTPRAFTADLYAFWALAALAYGVGDTLTTLTVLDAAYVTEANPLVAAAAGSFGTPGLVAWKLLAFCGCLAISVRAATAWRDRAVAAFPPLVLALLGAVTAVSNLRPLFG
ncbi:MAG: hypothetical protein ABEJ80_02710 [Halarchaeum sp.]